MNLDDYIKRPKIPTHKAKASQIWKDRVNNGWKLRMLRNRKKTACIRGHDLTLPGARYKSDPRICVECNKLACAIAYAANREKRQLYARMQYQKRRATQILNK